MYKNFNVLQSRRGDYMVNKTDAIEIITWAEENEINIWIDGGWGVDALLKEETRVHKILIYLWKNVKAKNLLVY